MNKHQILNGVVAYINNEMIPNAKANDRIILRGARELVSLRFDHIFEALRNNSFVAMAGLINGDDMDIEATARIASEAIGTDEFVIPINFLGLKFDFALSASDIATIKSYIERA